MVYDDLIIGSGLTGLAVACGLPKNSRLCVIAGLAEPSVQWYDGSSGIPCANNGMGGLGAYWHGVIPMALSSSPFKINAEHFSELFRYFYRESIDSKLDSQYLFVPYRPIRPVTYWKEIIAQLKDVTWVHAIAHTIERKNGIWSVRTPTCNYYTRRLWLAAGALGTPMLLSNSHGMSSAIRSNVSDHIIIYLGQLDRRQNPRVERTKSGIWAQATYDKDTGGLLTTKPARFSYARLDHGIEQRSVFGLPTSGLLGKLMRAGSLGLISESLFNKFGLFPNASKLNAYAQLRVEDAYHMDLDAGRLTPNMPTIQKAIGNFRTNLEWPELEPSRRPELFLRGIHLHHSLDNLALKRSGLIDGCGLTIVDPSTIEDIGPDHHSFKSMVRAYSIAKSS